MLRFDGEVFLFGTAIAAPLKRNKNCDDLCLVSAGQAPRRQPIVANRRPYSASSVQRKDRSAQSIGF